MICGTKSCHDGSVMILSLPSCYKFSHYKQMFIMHLDVVNFLNIEIMILSSVNPGFPLLLHVPKNPLLSIYWSPLIWQIPFNTKYSITKLLMFSIPFSRRFHKQHYLVFSRPRPLSTVNADAENIYWNGFFWKVELTDPLTDKDYLPK